MRQHRITNTVVLGALLGAAALITISNPAWAGREGELTRTYDLVVDEEVLIGERVGRVIVRSLTVEEKETSKGPRLFFHVSAKNPKKGHDQAVLVIVNLRDAEGKLIQSVDRQKLIEEGGEKTLKIRADLKDAPMPTSYELNIEAWDE